MFQLRLENVCTIICADLPLLVFAKKYFYKSTQEEYHISAISFPSALSRPISFGNDSIPSP